MIQHRRIATSDSVNHSLQRREFSRNHRRPDRRQPGPDEHPAAPGRGLPIMVIDHPRLEEALCELHELGEVERLTAERTVARWLAVRDLIRLGLLIVVAAQRHAADIGDGRAAWLVRSG